MDLIIGIGFAIIGFCIYRMGYCFGRADGIEWTRDVYNGKYDDEIFKDTLK